MVGPADVEVPITAPDDDVVRTTSWDWTRTHFDDPAEPPVEPGPKPSLASRLILGIVCTVVGALIEVVAWSPLVTTAAPFRIAQVFALVILLSALVDLVQNTVVPRVFVEARSCLATHVLMLALTLCAGQSMLSTLLGDLSGYVTQIDGTMQDYRRYVGLIDAMGAGDPSYDRREDTYETLRMIAEVTNMDVPGLDTLGVYKAKVALDEECRKAWRDAPTYDHARCDRHPSDLPASKPLEMVHTITGGPFFDDTARRRAAAHFSDHRYDKARAVSDGRR